MNTAVLIPSCNDDFSLSLSVPAIAPHVDEVIVFNDASVDQTQKVLSNLQETYSNLRIITSAVQVGWVNARNQLVSATDRRHLFFIDADDIFLESRVRVLEDIVNGNSRFVQLGLIEAYGDFRHGTGRGDGRWAHYDKCHCYVDKYHSTIRWRSNNSFSFPCVSVPKNKSGEVLFCHAKGVKSDWRLRWRNGIRNWLKRKTEIQVEEDPQEVHQHIINMLLTNKNNRIRRINHLERIPQICLDNQRFEMVYQNGKLVDRIDRGFEV